MGALICGVEQKSPAHRARIRPGDELIAINGHKIKDVLDYKFYAYDAKLKIELSDRQVRVRKQEGEDLGLVFESYLMDKAKRCSNKCVFCFIDQLPSGMRETLYFKDDDARMSFLMGNYISLTNLSQQDIDRMIRMRISPVNISVQATDPQVRRRMLGNPRAGECMDILKRFADAGLALNCQIVVCPGYNDGSVLRKSLEELCELAPSVASISVVPVGLTRHREGLTPLIGVDQSKAREIIEMADEIGKTCLQDHGSRIVYCADELFIKAGYGIPEPAYYEDYPQLENGVGLIALLKEEFELALQDVSGEEKIPAFTVATGVSAAPFIRNLIDELAKKCDNVFDFQVIPVTNNFFGSSVNVAGLVCGQDLRDALKGRELFGRVLIPEVMLRHGTDVFLDDVRLTDLQRELGVPVIAVPNDGGVLLDCILAQQSCHTCG